MFEAIYSGMPLFFILTSLFGLSFHFVLRTWFYFNERNVKFVRGLPLLGSTFRSTIGLEPAAISFRKLYEHFPNERFFGIYDFGGRPSYLIRDPDLIKQIITDCKHFMSNKLTIKNENDYFSQNLFGMCGSKWSEMEHSTNHLFSTNKMQMMHELIVKNSEQFIKTLKQTDKIAKIFDSRDLFTRYANDVIAKITFDVEMNSLNDIDNEFFNAISALNKIGYIDGLKFLASLKFPSIIKILDIIGTKEKQIKILQKFLEKIIKSRTNKKSDQNDLVDLLIQARNGQLEKNDSDDKVDISFVTAVELIAAESKDKIQNYTDEDITMRCLAFYLSNMSSVAQISCFMFHELALNPDIQDKLYAEINSVKNELNGLPLTYEIITNLKYLDMVLCETLRRWCPVPFVERTCICPYILENTDGKRIELQNGDGIFIPTYGLHMDDKYYPKPMKFNPERFSDENKNSIQIGTYLPFGIGTRNSIGSRITILTIKTLVYHLLTDFFVDKTYKTSDPLKLKALPLLMDAENGFFIELRRRNPDRTPYKSEVFS